MFPKEAKNVIIYSIPTKLVKINGFCEKTISNFYK